MSRTQFNRMIALAAEIGADAAYDEFKVENADAEDMADRDCDDRCYVPGCGEYDTIDYRGRPLLSRFNEAGEPRW